MKLGGKKKGYKNSVKIKKQNKKLQRSVLQEWTFPSKWITKLLMQEN